MSDRKAELERKKQKLQLMREEKKRKDEERKKKDEQMMASSGAANANQGDLRQQTDKMLEELGIPSAGEGSASSSPSRQPSLATQPLTATIKESSQAHPSPKRKITLTTSKVTQTNIQPKELVAYNKETQTPGMEDNHEDSSESTSPHVGNSPRMRQNFGSPKFIYPNSLDHMEWDDEFHDEEDDDTDSLDVAVDTPPAVSIPHKMPQVHMPKPPITPDDATSPMEEKFESARELGEEERRKIIMSDDFVKFFDRATRVVERALTEPDCDIFADYAGTGQGNEDGGLAEGEKLKLNRQFFDERWSKHRTITCLDWSTQYPELLVASYNHNEESPHDPDGVALIWNLKYKKSTPEYIFHCQSAVTSSCFAKFHPNLIVGGTYSGQIVLWDNRSNKRTPVQRTPLSAAAHTHPVYCVNVVGTQNAHNLISVSTDGKMCSWSLDMLSQPQDSMELQHKQTKSVAVTSFSFLSADVNNFVVGSEEGTVYMACRHGSKAGISDMFEGHQGPLTGIDCHTTPGPIDFSPYFITSSFDWTVKLWSIKENKPLHSFEDNSDYVYDVQWSPIHPALFATGDGMGRLDLWNLNNDTEVPTASTVVDPNVAINKVRWHQGGHCIAVGDDLGKIHIYDVGEPLAAPRSDEWTRFVHTLQDLKTEQAEQEEEAGIFSTPLR